MMRWIHGVIAVAAMFLASCAGLPTFDPPRVTLADIDSVSFEGLEMRMVVRLRVQNPNGIAIDYEGIDVSLALQGKAVAHGVSNERGSVPSYGETIVALP